MRNEQQQRQMTEAARMENARKECIAAVFSKYTTLIQCEANSRKILEDIVYWTQIPDAIPTLDAFEAMLLENPDHIKNYATQSIERSKEQIIEEVLTLLESRNGGRDGKFDSYNLRSEEARMRSWSLNDLRARLNEIKVRQRMAVEPVSALKTFVADAHRVTNEFAGWPNLPKSMWSSSQGRTITVDADYLNHLGKHDKYEFSRFVKLYGSAQIDHRRGLK